MISIGLWMLGVTIFLDQKIGSCEEVKPCMPGFSEELYFFKVAQKYLGKGRRLGRVLYDDCSGRQRFLFNSADSRFKVESDGTVLIKRPVTLHEGHKSFFVHAWDSMGNKFNARVWVQFESQRSHVLLGVEDVPTEQSEDSESVPRSNRVKRDWIIPPIRVEEGPKKNFPVELVKIRSAKDKEFKMQYWITGPGADEPPKNIFIMERNSGQLFLTQPLDREKRASYTLIAHAASVGLGTKEEPMEIVITVIDLNDNKPIFTQDVFRGSVPEAVDAGYEVMSVTATDADDPETYNADLRYSILGQEPQLPFRDMFAINPTSGQIRLQKVGLNKEKYPQYTLTVQATDYAGDGFSTTCKAIITVTDSNDNAPQFDKSEYEVSVPERTGSNDNAPQFDKPNYTASVPENNEDFEVLKMSVIDSDEAETPAWFTKFRIVQGNDGNVFRVSTAPGGLDGIITTIEGLDYEKKNQHTLLVTVENIAPFSIWLPTATATVVVNVEDEYEAPAL